MNPPKLEICFEGYNTDQADFYISQLIEKINALEVSYESAKSKIDTLENENRQLRNELLLLIKQFRNTDVSQEETPVNNYSDISDLAYEESKNKVNSAIKESLNSLRDELNSVKEFIKNY